MAQYKVGDRVRIVREWNNECHQNPEGLMDGWLGATMTIKSWNGVSYQMEEDVSERGENYGWDWFPAAIAGLVDAAENKEEPLNEIEYNVGDQVRIVAEFKDRTTLDSRCRESWLGKIMTIHKKIVAHTTQGIKYIYYMGEDGTCLSWESKDIAGIEKESFVQGVYYESGDRVKVVSEWINMVAHPNGLLGQVVTISNRYIDFNAKGARWAYHIKEDFLEDAWYSDDFVGIASPEEDPMNKYHEGDEVRIVSKNDSMCIPNDGVVKWLGKKMTIHAKYSNYFRMKEDRTICSLGSRWYPFLIRGLESEVKAQEAKEREDKIMELKEKGEYEEVVCSHCGCVLVEGVDEIFTNPNGEPMCEECFETNCFTCEDCGDICWKEEGCQVYDGNDEPFKMICEICKFNEGYAECERCGHLVQEDDYISDGYTTICRTCERRYDYHACYECGNINTEDEMQYYNGEWYCTDCVPDEDSSSSKYVKNYDYKPYPNFLSEQKVPSERNALFMGVELEIDKGERPCACAEELAEIETYDDEFYMKHDGSLEDVGIEIVSHPATLSYHLNRFQWKEVFSTAKKFGYKSHDAGTCGLHVHVSRAYLAADENGVTSEDREELNTAKIILFVEKHWDEMVRFSRRDRYQLDMWAKCPDSAITPEDEIGDIKDKLYNLTDDRYQAVNLCNSSTIEFRLFRGTLNLNTFKATLEFVQLLCDYCKEHNLKEVLDSSWDDLISWREYPELATYLEERKMGSVSAK